MKKYDVFISYRRDDGAQYARIIQLLLENSGYSVFLDYEELRDGKFGKKIESAIKEAPIFILIFTRKYLSRCWRISDWVRKEIMLAIQEGKKIIPIVPDNIPIHVPLLINREIKKMLKTEQFSFIDFGMQLRENVRTIITERIENEVDLDFETIRDIPYSKILPFVMDESHHPVNYVEHDTKHGIALQPFTSLIIGFDDIGQEIFKFIYEFSSFIGFNNKKCKFKCYAVDENMDKKAGVIRAKMPAIGSEELSLIHTSVNSEKFWNVITDNINDLNYIVISLDDIKTSFSLLSQLYYICRVYNRNNVGLFIKCKNHRTLHDILKLNELMGTRNIHPFVIDYNAEYESALLDKAKELLWFNAYGREFGLSRIYELTNKSLQSLSNEYWNLCYGELAIERIRENKNISSYDAIIENNRRKAGIISPMLNSYTMKTLMGLHENNMDKWCDCISCIDYYKHGSKNQECLSEDLVLIYNIAHMEYERWLSSQKLFGYTFGICNDSSKKLSSYMVPWEELDADKKFYIFEMVEASIKMMFRQELDKNRTRTYQ